ncbi:MAG TPA: phosphate acyltransferase PlsX [Gemmatimonadaceae bacterium]|nr:phosphate acyltransferase PlsX [Gemmatimonadaceae bacterium]
MTEKRPIIAVDAMGGDNAPAEIVAGALLAARAYDADIVLVGDEAQIQPLLGIDTPTNIRIVHAPDSVPMDQHASQALRRSGTTSLGVAVSMVKSGDADAVVSAGNSGAFLAIALIKLRTIEGIARPAIATVWPALKGPTVLLDSGANVDCSADELVQFARIGCVYAEDVLGRPNPSVGLLSIGEEPEKGNAVVKEANALLMQAGLNFQGNVEGRDLPLGASERGPIDVVVCDGFVGNVILKFYESVAPMIVKLIGEKGVSHDVLESAMETLDYATTGGAPLLGVKGVSIIAHGKSSSTAIRNALHVAARSVETGMSAHIGQRLAQRAAAQQGVA